MLEWFVGFGAAGYEENEEKSSLSPLIRETFLGDNVTGGRTGVLALSLGVVSRPFFLQAVFFAVYSSLTLKFPDTRLAYERQRGLVEHVHLHATLRDVEDSPCTCVLPSSFFLFISFRMGGLPMPGAVKLLPDTDMTEIRKKV